MYTLPKAKSLPLSLWPNSPPKGVRLPTSKPIHFSPAQWLLLQL